MVKWGKNHVPILIGPEAQDAINEASREEYEGIAKKINRDTRVVVTVQVYGGGDPAEVTNYVNADASEVLQKLVSIGILDSNDPDELIGFAQECYAESSMMASLRIHNKHWNRYRGEEKRRRHMEGLKFVSDPMNDVSLFRFTSEKFSVGIGVHRLDRFSHNVSSCFCVPHDRWNDQIARGLLGYRMAHSPIMEVSYESLIVSLAEAAERAMLRLCLEAQAKDPEVSLPSFFLKACQGEEIDGMFKMSVIQLCKRGTKARPVRPPIPEPSGDA